MTSIIYDYADINSRLPQEHRSVEKPKAEKTAVLNVEATRPWRPWRSYKRGKPLVTDDDEDLTF